MKCVQLIALIGSLYAVFSATDATARGRIHINASAGFSDPDIESHFQLSGSLGGRPEDKRPAFQVGAQYSDVRASGVSLGLSVEYANRGPTVLESSRQAFVEPESRHYVVFGLPLEYEHTLSQAGLGVGLSIRPQLSLWSGTNDFPIDQKHFPRVEGSVQASVFVRRNRIRGHFLVLFDSWSQTGSLTRVRDRTVLLGVSYEIFAKNY